MKSWTSYIETEIFEQIKADTYDGLSAEYPDIFYTTVESSDSPAKFPTVYIQLLPLAEEARDMKGTTINAVTATVQVDITSNTTKSDVMIVADAVIDSLKQMRFELTSMPQFTREQDVHRAVMRARRTIGNEDLS